MADQAWRSKFFDVPRWWVESGIVPKSGPMSKALRDLYLKHVLSQTFHVAGPKEPVRRVVGPLAQQREEARNG
jgi:hypothetical protein